MNFEDSLDADITAAFLSSPLSSPGLPNVISVKRGRGRPPKNGICRVEKKSGRGRGRPRKEPIVLPQTNQGDPPVSAKTVAVSAEPQSSHASVEREDRVVENFQALLLTIDFLKKKHAVPDFHSIRRGIEGITCGTFNEDDLIEVLSACSKNFQVEWRQMSLEKDQAPQNCLCVFLSTEAHGNNAHNSPVSIGEKTEEYKKKFLEWLEQGKPRNFKFPPEPVFSPSQKRKRKTELSEKLSLAAQESKNVSHFVCIARQAFDMNSFKSLLHLLFHDHTDTATSQ